MQEYLNTHTAEQHGVHRYDFHDFGLDLDEERERVRPYQEHFDVRSEISIDTVMPSRAPSAGRARRSALTDPPE